MQLKRIKNIFLALFIISIPIFIIIKTIPAWAGASAVIDPTKYPWYEKVQAELDKKEEGKPMGVLVSEFYTFALGAVGVAALGALIYGGILWTVSGAVSTQQEAKEWISGAIWGLALLLAAYLILNTINPALVNLAEPTVEPVEIEGGSVNTNELGVTGGEKVGAGKANYQWTDLGAPGNRKYCRDVLGEGWVGVDGNLCGGTNSRLDCCGKN